MHPGRSARSHLRSMAATHNIKASRVSEVIEMTGLAGVATKRVGGFSLGMGQRLGIAAALLGDPRTLILDEPVNGLDPEGVQWVRQLVRALAAEGRTVFLSSHLMSETSQTADHLLVIGRGRIIEPGGGAEPGRPTRTSRHRQRAGTRTVVNSLARLGSARGRLPPGDRGDGGGSARAEHRGGDGGRESTTTGPCGRALYAASPWPSALAATDEHNARAQANQQGSVAHPPSHTSGSRRRRPHRRPRAAGARAAGRGRREVPQRGKLQQTAMGDDREQDGEDASGGHRTPPRDQQEQGAA